MYIGTRISYQILITVDLEMKDLELNAEVKKTIEMINTFESQGMKNIANLFRKKLVKLTSK